MGAHLPSSQISSEISKRMFNNSELCRINTDTSHWRIGSRLVHLGNRLWTECPSTGVNNQNNTQYITAWTRDVPQWHIYGCQCDVLTRESRREGHVGAGWFITSIDSAGNISKTDHLTSIYVISTRQITRTVYITKLSTVPGFDISTIAMQRYEYIYLWGKYFTLRSTDVRILFRFIPCDASSWLSYGNVPATLLISSLHFYHSV